MIALGWDLTYNRTIILYKPNVVIIHLDYEVNLVEPVSIKRTLFIVGWKSEFNIN